MSTPDTLEKTITALREESVLAAKQFTHVSPAQVSRLLAAIADRLAALPKQGWRPISEAPKDGSRVILAWGGKSVPAFWLDNSTKTISWAGWRTPSLEPVPNGSPTHWQPFPLPPPPEGEKT